MRRPLLLLVGLLASVCLAFHSNSRIISRPACLLPRASASFSLSTRAVIQYLPVHGKLSCRHRRNCIHRLHSNALPSADDDNDNDDDDGETTTDKNKNSNYRLAVSIANAALLIAGTTVGGGFLALPTVVAPSGFVPSATALVGVWAFFWVESLVIVECLCVCRAQALVRRQRNENGDADSVSYPGMTAAAKSAFGVIGESAVGVLLLLLLQATLVSQISRAGALFTSSSISSSYRVGCAATAMSVAAVVFGSPRVVATTANSLLTVIFVAMAVVLFGVGSPTADWSRLVVTGGITANWSGLPRAIPTFLQLLVYGEILPTVCQMLNYQRGPIRWAISVGSILPLLLEVGWAALGIALVPSGAAMGDPVDALLAAGPIQGPLFILAVTAILTTIVGSYLALQSTFNDVFPESSSSKRDTKKAVPWRRRLVAASSIIVLPALSIASISPDIFLRAIDFAGSYPVLLLWGLAPPAIAFRQRQKGNTMNPTDALPLWWLAVLASVSLGIFGMSAIPDLRFLVKTLQSLLQKCY